MSKQSRSYRTAVLGTALFPIRAILAVLPGLSLLLLALAVAGGDSKARDSCTSDCMTVSNGGPMIYGSGKMRTEKRSVETFDAVRVSVPATVAIERTGVESLTVTAEDNLLPLLDTKVTDGTLRLSLAPGTSFSGRLPIFRITVAHLQELDVAGSGTVRASKLDGRALSLTVSGAGDVHLAGRSADLDIAIDGSGSVEAAELNAKRATITVNGSGDVIVNASDHLDATIAGSGNITYLGSPKLKSNILGSGSISRQY